MTGPRASKGRTGFSLSGNGEEIERAKKVLSSIPGGVEKALYRSLNKSSIGARAEAVRQAKKNYHVLASRVRKTISIEKAASHRLSVRITSKGHPLPLSRFRITPKNPRSTSGIRVRSRRKMKALVRIGGSPVTLDRTFVAKFRSGHVGVFQRTSGGCTKLRELHSLSVPQMVGKPDVAKEVGSIASIRLVKELDHQIDRILGGH